MCDNILRCIHPEDRTKVLEELFSIAEEGIVKNSSHRIKTAAGEERGYRSAACVNSKSAGGKNYQIIFHDVTEILQLAPQKPAVGSDGAQRVISRLSHQLIR